jgi:hypothetical protein
MNARDLSRLAWTLQAQLPDLCIRDTVGDPLLQNAVADRCMATCRQAGVADEDARVIGKPLPAISTAGAVATPSSMRGSATPRQR